MQPSGALVYAWGIGDFELFTELPRRVISSNSVFGIPLSRKPGFRHWDFSAAGYIEATCYYLNTWFPANQIPTLRFRALLNEEATEVELARASS